LANSEAGKHSFAIPCAWQRSFLLKEAGLLERLCFLTQKGLSGGDLAPFIFFRPERLRDIARRFGMDEDTALDNVCCARAYNTEHQQHLLIQAAAMMAQTRFVYLFCIRWSQVFAFNCR
jgi:hypothetical protein